MKHLIGGSPDTAPKVLPTCGPACSRITALHAVEILDSRGWPTLLAKVSLENGQTGAASVAAGASTGRFEAVELRDGDPCRYAGRGVRKAIAGIQGEIAAGLLGENARAQSSIDARLRMLDGTADKGRLGANAILAVSLANARAAAASAAVPLYRFLGGSTACRMPVPMMNVINGGKHADNGLAFQEFMIVPHGAPCFSEAVRWGSEVYHALGALLKARGQRTAVGDEGGFAPDLASVHEACDLIVEAIGNAGLRAGSDVALALDPAATSFHSPDGYHLQGPGGVAHDSGEMIRFYARWLDRYPIVSIEDGLAEDDAEGAVAMAAALGGRVQLVGDDMFVTDPARIRAGVTARSANAVLIKPNQIGTLTETLAAIAIAGDAGWSVVISHRSGETDDSFIADLAVACGAGQIKAGAPCRGERVAKYNRLLEIEAELGSQVIFQSPYTRSFPA